MSTPQIQTSNAAVSTIDPASQETEQGNNQEAKKACIFGRVAKVVYDIVTYIPKKIWAGLKYIYNAIVKAIHGRKVSAVETNYQTKIDITCQTKIDKTWSSQRTSESTKHDLAHIELMNKGDKASDFPGYALNSTPEKTREALALADKKAEVSSHTKQEFMLEQQAKKLKQELVALEDEQKALKLESDEITEKIESLGHESYHNDIAKMLFRALSNKTSEIEKLQASIDAKTRRLDKFYDAQARHIWDLETTLAPGFGLRKGTEPVAREEMKVGIAEAAMVLTAGKGR